MEWSHAERNEGARQPVAEPVIRRSVSADLTVGSVDDPAEHEADSIAAHVVRMLATPGGASPTTPTTASTTRIRRMATPASSTALDDADPDGEDEHGADLDDHTVEAPGADSRATTPGADTATIARSPLPRIRRSALAADPGATALGTSAAGGPLAAGISQRIQRSIGGGRPLDAPVRARIQPAFSSDLANVRVHTDAAAGTISRDINARAFTVGRDVFFGKGEYRPSSNSGMELLAHELAHVEQQSPGQHTSGQHTSSAARRVRRSVIRRRFQPAVALSKAHLRNRNNWGTLVGAAIPAGTGVFVDDDPAQHVVQQRRVRKNVTWVPAVNVDPAQPAAATGTQVGYIRSSRTMQWGRMEKNARRQVITMLRTAEQRVPGDAIKDQLNTTAHVDFLLNKAVRLDEWNPATAARGATFGAGIGTLQAKYDRINEGAEHVADTLAHWRNWLHPTYPTLVDILDVKLIESDLHEHGLGVMMVKFRKPTGGAAMFANQTIVEAVIKPEDKSLEKALLGSQPTSAASQANQLAGLAGNQQLGTLNMEVANVAPHGAQPVWTTLVERVKGKSSETMVKEGTTAKGAGTLGVIPAFHETLVFAWLAGIDDLHWENVIWLNDVPYLIDADSVLSNEQMTKTGSGDKNQSGFSTVNKHESDTNRDGIKRMDAAAAKSKLLDEMKKSTVTRDAILLAIKQSIAGHKGRTVPIYTNQWAQVRNSYQQGDARHRNALLDDYSTRRFMVGDGPNPRANTGQGPGLKGTTGVNPTDDFFDAAAMKAQLKNDMDASVVPFFEYHYDTGHVTYNGAKIFHGLTIDQAFTALVATIV